MSEQRGEQRLHGIAAVSLATGIVLFFVLGPIRYHYWADSWSYYELAQSIGNNFYAVRTIREFSTAGHQSSAYPPLWPLIIAVLSRVGFGALSLYIAAFLSYGAFALAAERLSTRLFSIRGIGLLSALTLLAFTGMRWDIGGGGSISLFLCFLALAGSRLLSLDIANARHAATLGVLAGLMIMLRFDAVPAALVVLVAGVAMGIRRRPLAVLALVFVVAISPWILYSWTHFHTPFVTDNRVVALSLDPHAHVLDFHATPAPTLADDPAAWFRKLVVHVPLIANATSVAVGESVFLLRLGAVGVVAWCLRGRVPVLVDAPVPGQLRSAAFLALVAAALAPLVAYVITGYAENRYFSTFIWISELIALGFIFTLTPARFRVWVCAFLGAAGVIKSAAMVRYIHEGTPLDNMRAQFNRADVDSIAACMQRAGAGPDEGVFFRTHYRLTTAWRLSPLTHVRAAPEPRNWLRSTPEQRLAFLRKYNLTFVYDSAPGGGDRFPAQPVPGCPQYLRRYVRTVQ